VVTRRGSASGNSGSAGEQIQGIDPRQVLAHFDGQPLVGARGIKSGVLNLDRQSIAPIESIEVVKGASSALYGSDAIGGGVNQISRDPRAPVELNLTASGGSQGRADYRGDIGFGGENFTGFFSGERHKQNPFDLTPKLLQAGAKWTTDRYRGFNRLADDSGHQVDTAAFFAQDKINFGNRVTATVGARFDHNSIFGNAFSPKAGFGGHRPPGPLLAAATDDAMPTPAPTPSPIRVALLADFEITRWTLSTSPRLTSVDFFL
jgi:outer membrane receptor for ferrienterochelin and colicin